VEKKRVRIFDRVVGGRIAEAVECPKVCSTHYDERRNQRGDLGIASFLTFSTFSTFLHL
jgi:hypothetical protein